MPCPSASCCGIPATYCRQHRVDRIWLVSRRRFWRTSGASSTASVWYLGVVSQQIDVVGDSLPKPDLLVLEGIDETEKGVVIRIRSKEIPRYPACLSSEVSLSQHLRSPSPRSALAGATVQIQLKTLRFRCRDRQCKRKVFAKRLPRVAVRRARETDRVAQSFGWSVTCWVAGLPTPIKSAGSPFSLGRCSDDDDQSEWVSGLKRRSAPDSF
jgi:hypothetical protein